MQKGREIFILVLFLVLVTVIGIGYLIYWLMPGIELIPAFALAAVLSPTDAVALSSIVGKGRIPKQMMGILEGEALMNDASGLVALKFAVAIVMGTMIFSVTGVTLEFFKVAIGGLLAGVAVTWLYSKSLRLMSRWSGMTRHANRLYVTAAVRLLSDCGTHRCVRYPGGRGGGDDHQ